MAVVLVFMVVVWVSVAVVDVVVIVLASLSCSVVSNVQGFIAVGMFVLVVVLCQLVEWFIRPCRTTHVPDP